MTVGRQKPFVSYQKPNGNFKHFSLQITVVQILKKVCQNEFGSQNMFQTFPQGKTIKLLFYVFLRMVLCTFDWFILTFEHFEYSLTKLLTLKKYNKRCILTCNYKVALILNGLDHSGIAKHNVTSSLLHVTQQLPIQIPPPQRIFFVCEKMKRTRKPWFFYKLFKTRVFFILLQI